MCFSQLLTAKAGLLKSYVGVGVCPFDSQSCSEEEKMTIWGTCRGPPTCLATDSL